MANSGLDGGFGLFSMKERVSLLEGKIDIISEKGKGTKIVILIPFIDEGEAS
jgi:two-component system sensor histidine kinase DegS